MPDLTEAELKFLEQRFDYMASNELAPKLYAPACNAVNRLIAEVRRLRAENAELRKRAKWRETFKMKEST